MLFRSVLAAWRWLRTGQDLSATSLAVTGGSAGGGLAVALLVALRDAGEALPGADPKRPLALSGLPPLLVLVGTADVLLSDSKRLAEAAAKAGVDVTLEIGEGLPHAYPIMLGTPEAAEATGQIGKFLQARAR